MQRFEDNITGEGFVGRDALYDTMKDLITDAASALTVAAVGFFKNHARIRHRGRSKG